MNRHGAEQGSSPDKCNTHLQKQRRLQTSFVWMELLREPQCTDPATTRRDPGCIALVIFSSNRTGYHPHSQHHWRGCAPFRRDLNKTFTLTDPAAIYEYQCHLWESRAADRGISIHQHFCVGANYFTLNMFVISPLLQQGGSFWESSAYSSSLRRNHGHQKL